MSGELFSAFIKKPELHNGLTDLLKLWGRYLGRFIMTEAIYQTDLKSLKLVLEGPDEIPDDPLIRYERSLIVEEVGDIQVYIKGGRANKLVENAKRTSIRLTERGSGNIYEFVRVVNQSGEIEETYLDEVTAPMALPDVNGSTLPPFIFRLFFDSKLRPYGRMALVRGPGINEVKGVERLENMPILNLRDTVKLMLAGIYAPEEFLVWKTADTLQEV